MRRIAVAVAVVATLLVAVRALAPEKVAAAATVPELRSRPADVVLDDGFRHLVVHAEAGPPAGVDARPMGGGDWSVRTKLSDEAVRALPGVAAVSHDVWADPYAADPDLGAAWGLENDGRSAGGWAGRVDADIDASSAWDRTRGEGVVVAVIDTAVDRTHPELAGRMWRNADEVCGNSVDDDGNGYVDDCDGWDFARNDNTPYDLGVEADHGTHIAGTIAAESDNGLGISGVAPRATIMPLKVGDTGSFSLSAAAAAINYAVDNGAKVINASWGTTGVTRAQVPWLEAAVERARQAGVLIVAAAGNDARNIDASPSFPASFPEDNVITVGASTNADAAAYFSNYGATSVDVYAPGWFVYATLPGGRYGTMSGTSMAAPHVVGVAALAIAADPSAPYTTIKGNLLATVDRSDAFAGRSVSGGRVNAAAAVGESDQPVTLNFSGFAGLEAGRAGQWQVRAQADAALGASGYELSLVTEEAGDVYAVSGHAVTVGGTSLRTDDGGWVRVPTSSALTSGGETLTVGTTLPAGQYVLAARLVDAQGAPVAPAQALWFSVAGPAAEVPPVPPTPPVSEPAPAPQTPGGGYQPAPLPNEGQPVPPAPTTPPPCSSCGQPGPQVPVFVPPPPAPSTPSTPAPPTPPPSTSTPSTTSPSTPSTPTTAASAPSTPTTAAGPPSTPTTAPSTPTTAASAPTTAPSPSSTTTTTVVPSPAAPAPTRPLRIVSVSPDNGSRSGGSTIVIGGEGFPERPVVRLGGAVAQVSVAWPTMLLVHTPAHTPGVVDVSVSDGTTTVVSTGAYTYLSDAPAPSQPPAGSPTPSPSTTTTTLAAGPTTTTTTEVPSPSTTPTTEAPTASSTTSTTAGPRVPQPIDARGLHLVPLASGHPLIGVSPSGWPQRRCTSGSCAGSQVG
ncbi:MAG: peptidase and in kexin sedolisin [Acidimicrobiales bacterium]|nr:peptidase and in kexin sedolisin [Acidimicrobiales bacterium]